MAIAMVSFSVLYRYNGGTTFAASIRLEAAYCGLSEQVTVKWPLVLLLAYSLLVWPVGAARSLSNLLS